MRNLFVILTASAFLARCVQGVSGGTVIRYVALGDSYTICEGAKAEESWPVLLAKQLSDSGIQTDLVANPSCTGWTTRDLINNELSVFDASNAGFVTLCIGVNDWVRGVDSASFHKNLSFILDHIQGRLADKSKLLLLTIPDFSVTPAGARYAFGRDVAKGISKFNNIILAEAMKRNLATVDLFEVSKKMKDDPSLIAKDGLHPSVKEYALWEKLIFPAAEKILAQ